MASALLVATQQHESGNADTDCGIFERASRRYFHMSTEEFVQKWHNGFFKEHPELAHKAADVALLLTLLSAG